MMLPVDVDRYSKFRAEKEEGIRLRDDVGLSIEDNHGSFGTRDLPEDAL